jgi:hypothetical protein
MSRTSPRIDWQQHGYVAEGVNIGDRDIIYWPIFSETVIKGASLSCRLPGCPRRTLKVGASKL